MLNIKHKSIIIIGFIILIVFSITGCKKTEKNTPNNTTAPTLTMTPEPTETVTPKRNLEPGKIEPSNAPAQSGEASTSKTDESWIKAYYEYIVNNKSLYDPYLLLIDLNFDGIPELFNISIAEGSQAYRNGITYMNGSVSPIKNDNMDVSVFVGTMTNAKNEQVWYTRYYPFGLHNAAGSEINCNSYDCSDLFNITGDNLFQISFTNTNSDVPEASSVNVSILEKGKSINITPQNKKTMINWYLLDKSSDFASDWYNNQSLTVEEMDSLLPLAQFEAALDIKEQKSINIDLNKCYNSASEKNSLEYKLFYNQAVSWYNDKQIKQWDYFQ